MIVFFLFPSVSSQFSQRHFGEGGVSQYDLKYKENYITYQNNTTNEMSESISEGKNTLGLRKLSAF